MAAECPAATAAGAGARRWTLVRALPTSRAGSTMPTPLPGSPRSHCSESLSANGPAPSPKSTGRRWQTSARPRGRGTEKLSGPAGVSVGMGPRLSILLLLACSCVVQAPPRPPPRVLPPAEAVAIATQFARSRGLVIDVTHDARLDRRARWHVDLGGAGGHDRAVVTLDGFSGRVLAARLQGPRGVYAAPPPAPSPGGGPEPPPSMPPELSVPPPPGEPPPPPPPP
jgi:hypothetical protein